MSTPNRIIDIVNTSLVSFAIIIMNGPFLSAEELTFGKTATHDLVDQAEFYPSPSRVLRCFGLDKIDIGIRRSASEPFLFTREQLQKFLNDETHKEFLAITLEQKFVEFLSKSDIEKLRLELKKFVQPLNYRRVVILADGLEGAFVVEDSGDSPIFKDSREKDGGIPYIFIPTKGIKNR